MLAPFVARVGKLAVLDFETTGLDPEPAKSKGNSRASRPSEKKKSTGAEILEIGAVLIDAGEAKLTTLHSLIRVQGEVPRAIERLTGIRTQDLHDAPRIEDVKAELARLLRGRTILAHNADFEKKFLSHWIDPAFSDDALYLDSQDLFAVTYPDTTDLRLESFTHRLLDREEQHRGLQDAIDTLCVIAKIAEEAKCGATRSGVAREALQNYAPDSPWLALLPEVKFRLNTASVRSEFVAIGASDETPVPFDAEAIAAVLRDAARGRRHFENYRVREGQIELARRFVAAFQSASDAADDTESGRPGAKIVLLEGGTGIGKSLAYLAAAIPYVMETAAAGDRRPVVISTRTKLLQDQLLDKDIAAAARFLGYPELHALSIKGRANYACARRLQEVLAEGCEPTIFLPDRMAYATLCTASQLRGSGEVGGVASGIRRRFPLLPTLLRHSVSARADQCTREQCAAAGPCAFGKKRAALSRANLIVANHDLLLRWPPDYPSFTHVVVDEAHELSGVADEAYAQEAVPEAILDDFDEAFGKGKKARALLTTKQLQRVGAEAIKLWRRALDQEFKALGKVLEESASEYGGLQIPARPGDQFVVAAQLSEVLSGRLRQIASELKKNCDENSEQEEKKSALERVAENFEQAAENFRIAFLGANDDFVVAFENLRKPYDRWRLVIRPVSLDKTFRQEFLSKLECFAGVSASLFVGQNKPDCFAALGELGIDAKTPELDTFAVPSPFPYAEHMRVVALKTESRSAEQAAKSGAYAPRSSGSYSDDSLAKETAQVIADLARRLDGRTLGLFTNLGRMNAVADLLSETLRDDGIEVLTPRGAGDDPSLLVERFRAGRCVLLGARSFWQGLDIPGDALQAVVIEKYPFEFPSELRKRRDERLERAGIKAFEYSTLGKMMLYLKQMIGRLIRSEEDRGIVVIVEGRTDKYYFRKINRALPPGSEICVARREELGNFLQELGIATRVEERQ